MLRFDGRYSIFLTNVFWDKDIFMLKPSPSPQSPAKAFTLVELLVVISIVGLLAGLTVPAVSGALLKGKQADALNQLKQFGTMTLAYATENNGEVPSEGGDGVQSFSALAATTNSTAWYNVLPPLSGFLAATNYRSNPKGFYDKGSLFYSKAAKYPANKTASAYFAFGINSQLSGLPKLAALPYPSRTALFGEARLPDETKLPPSGGTMDSLGQPKVRDKRFVSRYNGVGIITFCDGHSEAFRATTQAEILDTNKVIWDPTK